jgi:DNA-directed RNA polymerase subunit RPC12/RpoP
MWNIVSAIMRIFQDMRTCPKCGNRQLESSDKRTETVRCKRCGSSIPAKKIDF